MKWLIRLPWLVCVLARHALSTDRDRQPETDMPPAHGTPCSHQSPWTQAQLQRLFYHTRVETNASPGNMFQTSLQPRILLDDDFTTAEELLTGLTPQIIQSATQNFR